MQQTPIQQQCTPEITYPDVNQFDIKESQDQLLKLNSKTDSSITKQTQGETGQETSDSVLLSDNREQKEIPQTSGTTDNLSRQSALNPQQRSAQNGETVGYFPESENKEKTNFANIKATPSSDSNFVLSAKRKEGQSSQLKMDNAPKMQFQFQLNLPLPIPSIDSADIKGLAMQQRVNIFKQLQKREKQKFLGIQHNKMNAQEKQIQFKFTQQRFRNRQLGAGQGSLALTGDTSQRTPGFLNSDDKYSGIGTSGSGTGTRSGMSRFVSMGHRQNRDMNQRMSQIENDIATQAHFEKQIENLKKQWTSDLRAFGIFQQNELWQFSQMNDTQQKQILICNLQQGKFQGLIDQQYEMLSKKLASNVNINQKKTLLNRAKHAEDDLQEHNLVHKISKRQSLDQAIDIAGKSSSDRKNIDERRFDGSAYRMSESPVKVRSEMPKDILSVGSSDFQQQLLSNSQISGRPQEIQQKDLETGNQNQLKIKHQTDNQITNSSDSDFEAKGVLPPGSDSTTNRVKGTYWDQNNRQEATSLDEISSKQPENELTIFARKYEDSKNQLEDYLRSLLLKYQQQINQNLIRDHKMGLGIEHLIPNYPKNFFSRQSKEGEEGRTPDKLGSKNINSINNDGQNSKLTRTNLRVGDQGLSGSNARLAQSKQLRVGQSNNIDAANKKKDQMLVFGPESTKNEIKKDQPTEEIEEGKEQAAIAEEVKKPRYFPPRRIPNPFESAAQEQEKFLQARKEALAKYSNISKNRYKQDKSQPLKYVVKPGNNSRVVLRVLEESGRIEPRYGGGDDDQPSFPGWEPADDHYDSLYNFKWKPTSHGLKFDMISKHGLKQLVNHVKGHGQLTTKDNLFLNMKAHYEAQKLNIYDVMPLTVVIDYLKDDVSQNVETVFNMIKIMEKHKEESVETINSKLYEMQLAKEKSARTPYKITDCCHDQQNLWLLKPTGFNRGIGIHIFQNFDQLRDIMSIHYGIGRGARDKTSIFQTHNHNHHLVEGQPLVNQQGEKVQAQQIKNFTFVIQKLIEKPALYLNRKFDIRQWVLLNASENKVYMYNECYVRLSSKEYAEYNPNLPLEEQITMQLTNNAIQKEGAEYEKFEEGNIISTHSLFEFISQDKKYNKDSKTKDELVRNFKDEMQKLIIDSFKSVRGKMTCQKHTFELLGYDFIIDEQLNTILIEVNTNPCIEEPNLLLKQMVPRMIDDVLNVVMDPLFNIQQCPLEQNQYGKLEKYKSKFKLGPEVFSLSSIQKGELPFQEKSTHKGYSDEENLWALVCAYD